MCRNCGLALFSSKDKFHSYSGWPSFDREIKNNINKVTDLDQVRTELLCSRCNAHLGHIFYGEGHTELNTRYCINSLALEFVPYKYPKIIQYFFEIHDFTQNNGQGGDIGEQYLSKIFYFNNDQYMHATNIINLLKSKGYRVATYLEPVKTFWAAECYHQEYYDKSGGQPYCHTWQKIF